MEKEQRPSLIQSQGGRKSGRERKGKKEKKKVCLTIPSSVEEGRGCPALRYGNIGKTKLTGVISNYSRIASLGEKKKKS